MKPIVAIVGRPNVGKSTLFNRLIQQRMAIIEDEPGITRDRIYGDTDWNGRGFTLIDTGGIEADPEGEMSRQVRRQAELAVQEADVVVFVLDTRTGLNPTDIEVADLLRRAKKPVIPCANKADNLRIEDQSLEFYRLGLGQPIAVSAVHGLGTGDLLDEIVRRLPEGKAEPIPEDDEATIKVAVIGRPNVGKSSLVNKLLGQERVIVSDVPGTTRDAVDVPIHHNGRTYLLIDTAGMRRKAKIEEDVERYSVLRTLRAIDRAGVVLTLIDATSGVTDQDKRIAGYAHEAGKAHILVINKWDLIEKDDSTMREYDSRTRAELTFLDYAPRLFISAKTGQRVQRVLDLIDQVYSAASAKIATSDLNEVFGEAKLMAPPPSERGKRLKLYYATQAGTKPPVILCFVNDPELVQPSYRRYLENQLRDSFPLEGTPIRLVMKRRD